MSLMLCAGHGRDGSRGHLEGIFPRQWCVPGSVIPTLPINHSYLLRRCGNTTEERIEHSVRCPSLDTGDHTATPPPQAPTW